MEFVKSVFLILTIISLINYLITSSNFLLDNKRSSFHKVFIEKDTNPPFSGGVFILISLLLLIPNNEINFKILIFLVFLTGFLSDVNILKSANLRFIIQIFLILLSLILLNTFVQSTKWDYLDGLLICWFDLLLQLQCHLQAELKFFLSSFYILSLVKIAGDKSVQPYVFNNNLFLVKNGSIIRFN